jgi:phage FluMu protein Com
MIEDGENRCHCKKLLFKYNDCTQEIEIKCPKCGEVNSYSVTDVVEFTDYECKNI